MEQDLLSDMDDAPRQSTEAPFYDPEVDELPFDRKAVRFGSKQHDKLIADFRRDFDHAARGKRDLNDMARRAYLHYRSYMDLSKVQTISKVYNPYLFTAVNTAVAREMQALFSSPPFLTYRPRGKSDTKQAQLLSALFDYHWNERRPREPVYQLLLQAHLFGTSYAIAYWREEKTDVCVWCEEEEMVKVESVDEFGVPIEEEIPVPTRYPKFEERTVIDSPWFDPIHFLEALPDWEAETVKEGRYFIHTKLRSRQYIKARAKSGEWDKSMVKRILESPSDGGFEPTGQDTGDALNTISEWQALVGLASSVEKSIERGDLYEVAEHITNRYITTIVNRRFVVARRRNIFGRIPVLQLKMHPVPGEHFGMSDFEVVEKLVIHLQNMTNASGSEALLSVFTPMLAKQGVNIEQLKIGPGKVWRVNATDDVVPFRRDTSGIEVAQNQEAAAKAAIDDALATSDAYRGALPGREQKATAINTSVQAAGIRMQEFIERFEECFTIEIGDLYRFMMQLMQDKDVMVRLTDDPNAEPTLISPEEIYDADCDTVPIAGSSQAKELEVKRLLEFLNVVMNFRQELPDVDARELIRVVSEYVIPKHATRIMKSIEQVQQEQQQAMMQQQQMAMAQQQQQEQRGAVPVTTRTVDKPADGGTEELSKEYGEAVTA